MTGTFTNGSLSWPVTGQKATQRFSQESWTLVETTYGEYMELRRIKRHGVTRAGGFTIQDGCNFIACGGRVTDWTESGYAHTIKVRSTGACKVIAQLDGVLDPATKYFTGTWASNNCHTTDSGTFIGGLSSVTHSDHLPYIFEMIRNFADSMESESASVMDAFHPAYLNDGLDKSDWQTQISQWFADYDNLEVSVPTIRQIFSVAHPDIHSWVDKGIGIDWTFEITGEPITGGPREHVYGYDFDPLESSFRSIDSHTGKAVFTGNGESASFEIGMPILETDGATVTFGVWPYGVHGGGHPEGHPGVDIEYAPGAKVRAASAGTVISTLPNPTFPTQTDLLVEARPSVFVQYGHMAALEPGIVDGATISEGDILGDPASPLPAGHSIIHFAVQTDAFSGLCPTDFMHPAGLAVWDSLFQSAAYYEELVEPRACNEVDVTFPLTTGWNLVSGSHDARIEFTNSSASSADYAYSLLDSSGVVTETGSLNWNFSSGHLDLYPTGGPTKLCLVDIVEDTMWIDWDTVSRPTDFSTASVYLVD